MAIVGWPSGDIAGVAELSEELVNDWLLLSLLRELAPVALLLVLTTLLEVLALLALLVAAAETLAVAAPVAVVAAAEEKLTLPLNSNRLVGGGGTAPGSLAVEAELDVEETELLTPEPLAEVVADRLLAAKLGAQLPPDPLVAAWYRIVPVSIPAGRLAPAQPVSSIPMPIGAATNGISRRVAPILVLMAQLPFIAAISSPTSWAKLPCPANCSGRAYSPVDGEGKSRAKGGSAGPPGYPVGKGVIAPGAPSPPRRQSGHERQIRTWRGYCRRAYPPCARR